MIRRGEKGSYKTSWAFAPTESTIRLRPDWVDVASVDSDMVTRIECVSTSWGLVMGRYGVGCRNWCLPEVLEVLEVLELSEAKP